MTFIFKNIKEKENKNKSLFNNEELEKIVDVFINFILTETNKELKKYKNKFLDMIQKRKEYELQYKKIKTIYEENVKTLSKNKQIYRILNILNKLIIDGKLTPKFSMKVHNLINTIYEKNFEQLKNMEEKLSAYID